MKRAPWIVALGAALLAAVMGGTASATPASGSQTLRVVAFNVLAPIWAAPKWYPATMDASLLATPARRASINAFLQSHAADTDVFCLQEVQDTELAAILAALGPEFTGFMAENDRDWWSNWVVPEIGWAPNGPAIVVRRSSIHAATQEDIRLSDGNHAALLVGTLANGLAVRVVSLHLDSDRNNNRLKESQEIVAHVSPQQRATVDIACGDFNEDTVIGSAAQVYKAAGFVDAFAALGNREPTHPFSSSYNASQRWAVIDHVLVRGGAPLSADVIDNGLWSIPDEVERIEENLRLTGSDHFPLIAEVSAP